MSFALRLPALLLLLFCFTASAQSLEELKKQYSNKMPDTARINLANKIAWLSSTTDSAVAFRYAGDAYQLSSTVTYAVGKGKALMAKGNYYISKAKGAEAAALLEEAVSLFSTINNPLETAIAKEYLGKAYVLQNQNKKALELFGQSEKVFVDRQYTEGLSMVYNNKGIAYSNLGEPEKAIGNYIKALAIDENQKNTAQINLTLNNIGKLFLDTKNFSEARRYLTRCIESSGAAKDFSTMGKAQLNCGNTYIMEGNYAKGIVYYEGALASFERSGFLRGVQACNNNLGALYIRQEQYEKALPYLQKALENARSSTNKTGVALVEQNIATTFTRMKNFEEAERWFVKAEATAASYADLYTFGEIYNHRAELDSARGDFKKAYAYKVKYLEISEKSLNEKNNRQINELQTKYETQKKEAKIDLLNKDNLIQGLEIKNQSLKLGEQRYQLSQKELLLSESELKITNNQLVLEGQKKVILEQKLDSTQRAKNIENLQKQTRIQGLEIQNRQLAINRRNVVVASLALAIILLGLLGYSFYKRKRLQQEARLQTAILQQQQTATKAVLEAEETERQRIAKDLHDGIGQMMSVAKMNLSAYEDAANFKTIEEKEKFEKIIQLVDESCMEVRAVSHNMMPNALLKNSLAAAIREFISKLDSRKLAVHLYTEGLEERLDTNTEAVLYRVIQECVNNVIKHSGADKMDISVIKDKDEITATVEDNGRGFDAANSERKEGMGLKNIRTRIAYLKGTVDFDAAPGRGTLVALHVPL